jgi:hypothetical protein
MVWVQGMNILTWFLGAAFGAFIANYYLDHTDAYNSGYTQGQFDQAAIQQELRKGICE